MRRSGDAILIYGCPNWVTNLWVSQIGSFQIYGCPKLGVFQIYGCPKLGLPKLGVFQFYGCPKLGLPNLWVSQISSVLFVDIGG